MKLETTFDDLKGLFYLCLRCRECTYGDWPENYHLCPIHRYHRIFTASAGGLIYLMAALSENRIDYVSTIAELAYECPTCGFCDVCEVMSLRPPHISPTELIRFLRHQLVQRGLVPDGEMKKLYKQVKKDGDYLGDKVSISQKTNEQGYDAILFAECLHTKGQQDIYHSTLRLLKKIGKAVDVFSHGGCCGSTLYDLGFWDELSTLLLKNSEEMVRLKGKETIFINPHCQEFMIKRYPQISSGHQEIRGKHISELLADALDSGKLKVKNGQSIKVSYHDPCYLGRELGIYDAPRKVISFLVGVELIEMKRNKGNAYCCGAGGGGGGKAFPAFSKWVVEDRLQEFKETGADLLITACPYCKEAFQKALSAGEESRVKDLVELVGERVS